MVDAAGHLFTLKWDGYYHVLKVDGFQSEDEAALFLKQSQAALSWLLLSNGVAFTAELEVQSVRYFDDPAAAAANISKSAKGQLWERVDAIIQGSQPAVYATNKEIRTATAFPLDVHSVVPATSALNSLIQGASFPGSDKLSADDRLNTALSLYSAHFTEQSAAARFLTLIMALEALAIATQKDPVAVGLLERWAVEVKDLKAQSTRTAAEVASLDALERELLFRREDSFRTQIRKIVLQTLATDDDAESTAREAVRLYDVRSRLVHQGKLEGTELDQAAARTRELVQRVLVARFKKAVQG